MKSMVFSDGQLNLKSGLSKSLLKKSGILILILSYSFLAYKLFTFKNYPELVTQLGLMPYSQLRYLAVVLLLLPLNWLLESVKWKMLVSKIQSIKLIDSFKAVLAGVSTGFFTPNRVGEFVGRLMYMNSENRKAGVTLSLVNSLTQNLVMAMCGIPAVYLFFFRNKFELHSSVVTYLIILIVGLIICGIIYFLLPVLSKRIGYSKISEKITSFTSCLSEYSWVDLTKIIGITFLRYVVFCTQFYFMILFFDVHLSFWQALIAIPSSYLFVTFTPSMAYSEAAVRSSYAVLFVGAFSHQEVSIILSGVCIWLLNFVIPMLVGSVFVLKTNRLQESNA